jgi:hypothetical protein
MIQWCCKHFDAARGQRSRFSRVSLGLPASDSARVKINCEHKLDPEGANNGFDRHLPMAILKYYYGSKVYVLIAKYV